MVRVLVSIFDKKADQFQGLYVVASLPVAIRMFGDTLSDGESVMAKHPEDFALYMLGDLDDETGELRPLVHGGPHGYGQLVIEAEVLVRQSAQDSAQLALMDAERRIG